MYVRRTKILKKIKNMSNNPTYSELKNPIKVNEHTNNSYLSG